MEALSFFDGAGEQRFVLYVANTRLQNQSSSDGHATRLSATTLDTIRYLYRSLTGSAHMKSSEAF